MVALMATPGNLEQGRDGIRPDFVGNAVNTALPAC